LVSGQPFQENLPFG